MTRKDRRSRRTWTAALVGAAVLGISFGLIGPAEATQVGISGDQTVPSTVNWDTPRTDTYAQNTDTFQLTSGGAGAGLTLRMRNSAGTISSGTSYGSWVLLKNLNGNPWNPPGTFYLTSYLGGACGGNGCGVVHWTGNFSYNVKYMP